MAFSLGPGVEAAIAENGEEARSDEIFIILTEGNKVSQTFSNLAIYYWLEADNAVRRVPF